MKTLADEILGLLAEELGGITAEFAVARLAVTAQDAREAMHQINEAGGADLIQLPGSRQLYLVWKGARSPGTRNICANCHKPFERAIKSNARTCGRPCSCALSWRKPGTREKRIASIKADRKTPKAIARLAAHNKRRWAKPEEHAKLSQDNKRRWSDPAIKAKMARGIRKVRQAPEKRAHSSKIKKEHWADPEIRQRQIDGIKLSKRTPEARAKFSKLLRERWKDPVMREKYTRANVARNNPRHRSKSSLAFHAYWNDPKNSDRAAETRKKIKESRESNLEARRTPERLAVMKLMLADNKTIGDCAAAFDEPYGFVRKWAKREGLKSTPKKSPEVRAKISASNKLTKARKRQERSAIMQQTPQ